MTGFRVEKFKDRRYHYRHGAYNVWAYRAYVVTGPTSRVTCGHAHTKLSTAKRCGERLAKKGRET